MRTKSGQAGATISFVGVPEVTREELACMLVSALRSANKKALFMGAHDDMLIDGSFNFLVVARELAASLSQLNQK